MKTEPRGGSVFSCGAKTSDSGCPIGYPNVAVVVQVAIQFGRPIDFGCFVDPFVLVELDSDSDFDFEPYITSVVLVNNAS